MAPEIALGQRYNLKADVYSFAIIMYEVFSLEKLFDEWKLSEISERVHHNNYRPRLSIFWSKRLKETIRSCWSAVPEARLPIKHVETILHKEAENLAE